MSGYVALAPALGGGPLGWAVWAVGGTAITIGGFWLGGEIVEAVDSKRASSTTAIPKVQTNTCTPTSTVQECQNKRYGLSIQAQGVDCGGTSKSTIAAKGYSRVGMPYTVHEGLTLSAATWALLTTSQREAREEARSDAEWFIACGPEKGGYPPEKYSFPKKNLRGGKRYDVDIYSGPAFMS